MYFVHSMCRAWISFKKDKGKRYYKDNGPKLCLKEYAKVIIIKEKQREIL
jgi:hypothetical protein